MIATTNLTTNLDKAFERRFLYKIRFDKPTVNARAEIWQTMLKGLSEEDAQTLASKFDLSGGEIENIARREFDSWSQKFFLTNCCTVRFLFVPL